MKEVELVEFGGGVGGAQKGCRRNIAIALADLAGRSFECNGLVYKRDL
jgi:hypothetical protein